MKPLLISSLFLIYFGCAKDINIPNKIENKSQVDVNRKLRLEVMLISHTKNGFHLDYMDGKSISLDISEVVIVNPAKYKGYTLNVSNTSLSGQSEKWKKKGASFYLLMPEALLKYKGNVDVRLINVIGN